jgi:hypothetical protein
MDWDDETVWCNGCGAEITWNPVLSGKHRYCCQDCLNGKPCRCAERMEIEDERRQEDTNSNNLPGGYPL